MCLWTPRNGYQKFSQEMLSNGELNHLPMKERMTEIGGRWQRLPLKDKDRYKKIAEEKQRQYKVQLEQWLAVRRRVWVRKIAPSVSIASVTWLVFSRRACLHKRGTLTKSTTRRSVSHSQPRNDSEISRRHVKNCPICFSEEEKCSETRRPQSKVQEIGEYSRSSPCQPRGRGQPTWNFSTNRTRRRRRKRRTKTMTSRRRLPLRQIHPAMTMTKTTMMMWVFCGTVNLGRAGRSCVTQVEYFVFAKKEEDDDDDDDDDEDEAEDKENKSEDSSSESTSQESSDSDSDWGDDFALRRTEQRWAEPRVQELCHCANPALLPPPGGASAFPSSAAHSPILCSCVGRRSSGGTLPSNPQPPSVLLRYDGAPAASHWFGDVRNTSTAVFRLDLKAQDKSFNVESD